MTRIRDLHCIAPPPRTNHGLCVLFLVVASWGLPTGARSDPLFAAPFLAIGTGHPSSKVVIADINSDGRADMGVSSAVVLGNGDGTFSAAIENDSRHPEEVADFDHDGKLDLVSAGVVQLGNGDGTFGPPINFDSSQGPSDVADLNGDGRLDLVTPGAALMGHGDGTFGPRVANRAGGWSRAGDVNGDGKVDLIWAGGFGVFVVLGNGDGTFGSEIFSAFAHAPPYASPYASGIEVGDLNGDGLVDAVTVGNGVANVVAAWLSNGDGTMRDLAYYPSAGDAASVAIGDLNGDGEPDLAVSCHGIQVFPGNGDGTFGAWKLFPVGYTVSLAIGDLNGDGKPDLAAANYQETIRVLLGNGDCTFGADLQFATPFRPQCIASGDLNGDRRVDLLVTGNYEPSAAPTVVSTLMGNGEGAFSVGGVFGAGTGPFGAGVGDFDRDGNLDVVVASAESSKVSVLRGNGDCTLGPAARIPTSSIPGAVLIGDMNGDGILDLVVPGAVLLGNGDATFGPEVVNDAVAHWYADDAVSHLAIGDLNGDGKLDVASTNPEAGSVAVFLGHGDGTLGPGVDYATGSGAASVAIGDLNGDGRGDIAVADATSHSVSVFLSAADGTLGTRGDLAMGDHRDQVLIGDLDGDGRADLAAAYAEFNWAGRDEVSVNAITVLLGKGDGTFGASANYGIGPRGPSVVAVADVNVDGRPDLVTSNRDAGTISVLLNQGHDVVTEALLVMFEGSWTASGIQLRWQLGTAATGQDVMLRRSENEQGPWSDLGAPSDSEDGTTTFKDNSAQPGHAYFYRLFASTSSGGSQMLGSLRVGGMAVEAPRLLSVAPSPSRGMTRVKFAVDRESKVSLSVVDVLGRRVRSLLNATRPPGEYSVIWDGESDHGTAPTGLYFVRYEADGARATCRIVRVN